MHRRSAVLATVVTLLAALLAMAAPTTATAADAPPPPVTGLTAVSATSAVRLQWTNPVDPAFAGVEVRRLEGKTPPASPAEGALVTTGAVSTVTDTGLDWATTYAYAVFSVGATGAYSAPVTVLGIPSDLPNVTGFKVVATSTSSLSVTWTLPADTRVAGVRLERIACVSPYPVEATVDVAAPATSYVESGLVRGTKYCYRALTYDAGQRTHRGLPLAANATAWWAYPVTEVTAVSDGDSVALSWRLPDDPSVTGVRVARGDGVQVFDGAGTSVVDDNGVLPGRTYTYTVTAHTDEPRFAPVVTARVSTVLGWDHTEVDPMVGWPMTMSCATATWCLATDASGRYQVLSGTTWSSAASLPATATAAYVQRLSCPVAGWCLGLGSGGFQRYSGGTWSGASVTTQPPPAPWSTLTCASSTWCVAMSDDGRYAYYDGKKWSPSTSTRSIREASWTDVACQVAGRCFAVGRDPAGTSWRATLVSGTWTAVKISSPWYDPNNIECPTSSWCMVTTSNGYAVIKGTTWGAWSYWPSGGGSVAAYLTCASSISCWGGDFWTSGSRWNGSTWSKPSRISVSTNQTVSIQCPRGSSTCHAIDARGRHYQWTSATGWRLQSTYDPTSGGLTSTGCTSDTRCFSIDSNGWLVSLEGTAWSRTTKLFYNSASTDCVPSGFCLSVDNDAHQYRTYAAGAWSWLKAAPTALDTWAAPSCGSATSCVAVDSAGTAWRFDGSSWATAGTPLKGHTNGVPPTVECVSGTWCMTIGYDGSWSRFNGTSWTAVAHLPAALATEIPRLSCAGTTMCLAVVDRGYTATWNGSAWTQTAEVAYGGGYRLYTIDCVTAAHCVGVHGYSNDSAPVFWQQGWFTAAPYGQDTDPRDLDCPTLTTCFITTPTGVTRSRAT